MKKARFAVIGAGNQGTHYIKLLLKGEIKNAEITAICDFNPVKLDAIKEVVKEIDANSNVKFFSEYKGMLDSGLCDVVMVETPHYIHPEIVMECLKRGINALCDKPAGVYTKQVREMNEFATNSKAKFGLMFNQRTNCLYKKMREMIANGEIGELQRVTWIITDWFRTQYYYDNGSWRASWKGEGGGVLINQCPHQLDLIQWVVGELPSEVNAFCQYGKWHDIEVEDEVTAYLKYKNGATGVFITTTGEAPGTNRFEVSGTKGKLLCENNKLLFYKNDMDNVTKCKTATSGFEKPKMEIIEVQTDGDNPQHAGIMNNFANAVLGLEPLFVDGRDGICGVELMNAIELSGWKGGKTVKIPLNENEYLKALKKHIKTSHLRESDDNKVAKSLNFGTGQENVRA